MAEIGVQPGTRDQEQSVEFGAGSCRALDPPSEVIGDEHLRYECHAVWPLNSGFIDRSSTETHNPVGEWRAALQATYPGAEISIATPQVQVMEVPSESRIDWPEVVSIFFAVLIAGRVRGSWGSRTGLPWFGICFGILTSAFLTAIESPLFDEFASPVELALIDDAMADVADESLMAALLWTGLVGPIAEELIFRGAGWVLLARVFSLPMTLLLTSAVFAVGHGVFTPVFLTAYFISGLLFGYLRLRYASIWPPIAAHVANNLLVIGSFVLTSSA